MTLSFGQPNNSIIQFAYTVSDARATATEWTDLTGIGPWYFRGPFNTRNARYRGRSADSRLLVAQAFSGHTMIELIEQQDDSPSVYRERIETHGYGFHHLARASIDFERDVARYQALGLPIAYESILPTGARLVYFDSTESLGGMIELVEINEVQEQAYTRVFTAAENWDGRNPHRVH